MKFKKNTISAKQNTHVNNTNIKESNNIITKQTHVFTCFPFRIIILLYVLSSTIFALVQLSSIYSILNRSVQPLMLFLFGLNGFKTK